MSARQAVVTVIVLLIVSATLITVVVLSIGLADSNGQKVERMTALCVQAGHTGWDTRVGCFGGTR